MIWLLLSLALYAGAAEGQAQETPGVEPKIQTNNTPPAEQNSKDDLKRPIPNAASSSNVQPSKHADNASDEGTEFWSPFYGYRLKITDTLVVGFTALLFAATVFLYRATRDLVNGAKDTARKQLRAYIGISGFEFKCQNENNPDFIPDNIRSGDVFEDFIYVTIKNHGATPASDVHVWCRFAIATPFAAKLPKEHDITNRRHDTKTALRVESFATVHPGQTYSPRAWMNRPQWVGKAKSRQISLYLYGAVSYKDIFLAVQSTGFCYIYEPWHQIGDQFVPYERGNKAT